MRFLFVAIILLSNNGFASQETAIGKIFLGGFTFPKENYLTTQISFEKIDKEIRISLSPIEPYSSCIKEFEPGELEYSEKLWFSNNTLIRYKIPVAMPCSENGAKLFKLEVIYIGDTDQIKSVRLSPYRSKSYPYFSTEFN